MRITGAESVFLLIPPLFFNETPNVLFLFFLSEEAGFTEAAGKALSVNELPAPAVLSPSDDVVCSCCLVGSVDGVADCSGVLTGTGVMEAAGGFVSGSFVGCGVDVHEISSVRVSPH